MRILLESFLTFKLCSLNPQNKHKPHSKDNSRLIPNSLETLTNTFTQHELLGFRGYSYFDRTNVECLCSAMDSNNNARKMGTIPGSLLLYTRSNSKHTIIPSCSSRTHKLPLLSPRDDFLKKCVSPFRSALTLIDSSERGYKTKRVIS